MINKLFKVLWNNLLCLDCFTFKNLSLKVCSSNLTMETFILLKFITNYKLFFKILAKINII